MLMDGRRTKSDDNSSPGLKAGQLVYSATYIHHKKKLWCLIICKEVKIYGATTSTLVVGAPVNQYGNSF
jgi:hypothetical protein